MSGTAGRADLQRWTSSIEHQHETLIEASRRNDLEFRAFQGIQEQLTRRCAELEAEIRELKMKDRADPGQKDQDSAGQIHEQKQEIAHLRTRITQMSLTLEQAEQQNQKLALERRSAEVRALEIQATVAAVREELKTAKTEAEMLRQLVQTQAESRKLLQDAQASTETKKNRIDRQAERMKRYAVALTQEKKWIVETARRLKEKTASAAALHPLKDYLALTERELSRTEIELSRMPSSAEQRPQMQQCVDKLIRQREFLRGVLNAAEAEIARESLEITGMVQDSRVAPVPPPPEPTDNP